MSFTPIRSRNRKSRAVRVDLFPRNPSILANVPRQVYFIHIYARVQPRDVFTPSASVTTKVKVRAFHFRKRIAGTEHPSTLTSMNNLAGVLSDQGKTSRRKRCIDKHSG